MTPTANPTVFLWHCDAYDSERIRALVRSSMEALGLRPAGRALVKPNVVASGELFDTAYTRPEFVEGVLGALRDRDEGAMGELAVGERCGITLPTRRAFEGAGYDPMLARAGVKRYCFEEVPQVEVRYTHPERLRDYVFTPEPVAAADFFVNCPKFKAHPWTTVTFSIKNYIGIQDDRHRLIDHDHRLDEKIADLQHIVQPRLVCIDAITAGAGRMLTPKPFPLHLVVVGDNQVAVDSVCCRILGLDPRDVGHIRLAHEHGFGPLDLSAITLAGDVTLEAAQARAQGFEVGLVRVEKYFEGTRITAWAGPPPEPERTDYCWGGCPGAIEEAVEILRRFDDQFDEKMARIHVVFGRFEGPIPAAPGEKVVFMGDCAEWSGTLHGRPVTIRSRYRDRATKDPYTVEHTDVFVKMAALWAKLMATKGSAYVRFEGCPVSVSEQVLALCFLGGVKNPIFDTRESVPFVKAWLQWRGGVALERLRGIGYQQHGACHRGDGQPVLSPPQSPAE